MLDIKHHIRIGSGTVKEQKLPLTPKALVESYVTWTAEVSTWHSLALEPWQGHGTPPPAHASISRRRRWNSGQAIYCKSFLILWACLMWIRLAVPWCWVCAGVSWQLPTASASIASFSMNHSFDIHGSHCQTLKKSKTPWRTCNVAMQTMKNIRCTSVLCYQQTAAFHCISCPIQWRLHRWGMEMLGAATGTSNRSMVMWPDVKACIWTACWTGWWNALGWLYLNKPSE